MTNAMQDIRAKALDVTRIWDQLADCTDEFGDDARSACGELQDRLDAAILELMRAADHERWQKREQRMKARRL